MEREEIQFENLFKKEAVSTKECVLNVTICKQRP